MKPAALAASLLLTAAAHARHAQTDSLPRAFNQLMGKIDKIFKDAKVSHQWLEPAVKQFGETQKCAFSVLPIDGQNNAIFLYTHRNFGAEFSGQDRLLFSCPHAQNGFYPAVGGSLSKNTLDFSPRMAMMYNCGRFNASLDQHGTLELAQGFGRESAILEFNFERRTAFAGLNCRF